MQKPLDPMSVQRTETPSASYVLRRRYGPARYVIAVASWVTVINLLLQPLAALAGTITWDNGGGNNAWSTATNWSGSPDNIEPTVSEDAVFPTPVAGTGTITLGSGEGALSLGFSDSYTLILGDLTLGGTGTGNISVSSGKTVTIATAVGGSVGLTKSDSGMLLLANTATYTGTTTINSGTLKAATLALPSVTSASLRLRLESDLGVTTSGSNVTQWNDQSANAFHATQGTANNRPLLVAGASANGLYPAIRLDGKTAAPDYLSNSSQIQSPLNNGMTMFVVYKQASGATGEEIPFAYGLSTTLGNLRCVYISDGNNPQIGFGGYGRDVPNKYAIAKDTIRISTMTLNSARNSVQFWDRTTGDSSSTDKGSGTPGGGALVDPATGYSVGTFTPNVANYAFKGDIFAVLVYTGPLSDTDRQKVDNYLYNKYFAPNPFATNPYYSGQAALPSGTTLAVAGAGTFDMNGSQQTVAALTDSGGSGGTVRNSNVSQASTLTLTGGASSFSGTLENGGANGLLNVVYSGSTSVSQTFSGTVTLNSLTVSNPNATLNIANSASTISSIGVSAGVVNFNATSFGTAQTVTRTLTTAGLQTFIPTSSGDAQFYVWGAGGGGGYNSGSGGGGGYTTGTLSMTAGKTYQIMVGGGGASIKDSGGAGPVVPGGGGQLLGGWGGQGGGLSGIFDTAYTLANALAIGGGGGGGAWEGAAGGAGGGLSGVAGSNGTRAGGGGGSQSAGGTSYRGGTGVGSGLQGGVPVVAGTDPGGAGGGGGGYYGGGAGDNEGNGSGGGGGSGYMGGPGVSGATTTPGSGTTPGNTSSSYYISGTGYGGASGSNPGGNGQVTLVAPAINGAAVTLTGGTINFGDTGTGAAVAGADFSNPGTGVARADYAQPLTIGGYLKLPGGVTVSLSDAASFKASGSNLANNSTARTLTLSGGTLTLSSTNQEQVLPSGVGVAPVAWWRFNDPTNLGKDSSGNGYNMTVNGTVTTRWDSHTGAGAIQFSGAGKLVMPTGSNPGQLTPLINAMGGSNANTSQTLVMWIKKATWASNAESGILAGMGGNIDPYGNHVTWGDTGNAYLGIFRSGGGTAQNSATAGRQYWNMASYVTTGWFMMAIVRDNDNSENTWKAYVQNPSTGNLDLVDSTTAGMFGLGSIFELGANQGNTQTDRTNSQYFTGNMDDVMLFNTALNTAQLNALKNDTGAFRTDFSLPNTHIAATASSVLDMGGVTTGNLGNLTVGADLAIRNVATGGTVQFGGDVVADAACTVSLAAGAGSVPGLTLAGSNIKAADGVTLVLPAASLAGSVAVGNATGYAGTVTLGGATSLASGATVNVNAGTLTVSSTLTGSGGANVQVNNGGTLGGTGTIDRPVQVQSGGRLAPGDSVGALHVNNILSLQSGAKLTYELGSPSSTYDTVDSVTTLSLDGQAWDDFTFVAKPGFGLGTYVLVDAGALSGNLGGSLSGAIGGYTGTLSLDDTNKNLILTVTEGSVKIPRWDGGGADNNWSTPGNWSESGTSGDNSDTATIASGDNVVFYRADGVRLITGVIDSGFGTPINSLTFGNGQSGTVAIGGTTALTLNGGLVVQTGFGAVTLSAPISLGGPQSWVNNSSSLITIEAGAVTLGANTLTVSGGGDTTITATISGTGGLTKAGAGILELTGANEYSGATTVRAGTVVVGANAPSGSNGALGNATSAIALGDAGSGVSTIALLTGGAFTIGRSISVTNNGGGTTIGGNTAANSAYSGAIALSKDVTLQAASSGTVTFSGLVTGSGRTATLDGAGEVDVLMAAAGTSDANYTVNTGGNRALGGSFGTGSGTFSGAIMLNKAVTLQAASGGTVTFSGPINGSGQTATLTGDGAVNVVMAAAGTNSANFTINAGGNRTLGGAFGTGNGTFSGTIALDNDTTFTAAGGTLTFTGVITGAGKTATLAGAGEVDVLTAAGSNTADFLVNSGGARVLGGSNTSGTVQYSGNVTLNRAVTLAAANGGTVNFGTGTWNTGNNLITINCAGTGVVQLGSPVSTTAGITVSAGRLNLNAALTGNMTVQSGTTLGGTGSVSGMTGITSGTVNGTGLVLTGVTTFNSTGNTLSGTVTSGSGVTLASGAALAMNGALTGDVVVGNGTLSGNGSVSGTTSVTGGTVNGTVLVLTGVTTFNSTGNTLTGTVTSTDGVTLASGAALNLTGTLTGNATLTSGAALNLTGTLTGNATLGNGTLTGTGTVSGNATLSGGVINFGTSGNITGTLGVTGGNWNGVGTVGGAVTSSSGTFTIGSGANLTATTGLNVTDGTLAGAGTLTGSLNYTSPDSSLFGGVIAGAGKTVTMNNPAATLTLGGMSTQTGTTTVSAGKLVVASPASVGGAIAVNGGTLEMRRDGAANAITLNGGTLVVQGDNAGLGGDISINGGNVIHTFRFSDNLDYLVLPAGMSPVTASVLVVGGGGGQGKGESALGDAAGGGGAGGLVYNSSYSLSVGSVIPVTVGLGGLGSTAITARGANGLDSVFGPLTAYGGGGGGSDNDVAGSPNQGADGGSGGGAANSWSTGNVNGGSATPPGQGNAGGEAKLNRTAWRGGSGGGGAGGAGVARTGNAGGAGGAGLAYSISGSSVTYAVGGAGGSSGSSAGGVNGTAGTGNGGGGAGSGAVQGGNGGSGIVIVSYPYAGGLAATTRLGGTITVSSASAIDAVRSGNTVQLTGTLSGSGNLNINSSTTSGGKVLLAGTSSGYSGTATVNSGATLTIAQSGNSNSIELKGGRLQAMAMIANPGTGGTVTTAGGDWVHTFNTVGPVNFELGSAVTASVLVVAGGGGGGKGEDNNYDGGGGGGAGGLLRDSHYTLSPGSYSISAGGGGAGSSSNGSTGGNGQDSYIQLGGSDLFRAIGGGGGGSDDHTAGWAGVLGGSGGGGAARWGDSGGPTSGGAGTSGQGYAGAAGTGRTDGGGGGGASAAGNTAGIGRGGDGVSYSISGSTVTYAGGGGGGYGYHAGGSGGGGAGGNTGVAGTDGLGGGGGGSGAGNGGKGGSGVVILRYPQTYAAGAVTVSGALTAANGTVSTLDAYGSGGTLTIATGGITGDGGITIDSSQSSGGVVVYSAANSYSGGTEILSGATLKASGSGTLGDSSGAMTVTGGTLDLNGTSQGVGNLSGTSAGVILNDSGSGTSTLTIGNGNSGGGDFQGVIKDNTTGSGTVALTKTGSGTITLSGASTFTGATTVNGGTLQVNGTLDTAANAVTVNGTGTLGGTGTIKRPVDVQSGGTLAPGAGSTGELTVTGDLALDGTAAMEINGTAKDKVAVSGALTYGGILKVTNLGGAPTPGQSWDLFDFGSQSGTFDNNTVFGTRGDGTNLPVLGEGQKWMFDYTMGVLSVEWAVTSTTYSLAAASASSLIHVNGTTTVTATIRNEGTGTADALDYTALGADTSIGSISGSTSGGGPVGQGGQASNSDLTFNGSAAGMATITPTVGTVVNHLRGGAATVTAVTPVTVGVFSGNGLWAATGSGSWGSGASADWTDANGIHAAPGTFAGFTGIDTATFGASLSAIVSLNGALPNLNEVVFAGGAYTVDGAGGGAITFDGTTTPKIEVTVGTGHVLSAPVILSAATECAVAVGTKLTLDSAVTGATLTKTGSGTLAGTGSIAGTLAVSAGILELTGARTVGSLTMGTSAFRVTGSGTSFGKVVVSSGGSVTLDSANTTLDVSGITAPTAPEIVLIEVPVGITVSGRFSGLTEGTLVPVAGTQYKISYTGGDGNDVALVPGKSGTLFLIR